MMSYINETDFVIENKELVYPEIVTDGLQLYYDAKGKRDTDYHRDIMLDMSGNKNHGKLHNFAYEKHSGYRDGLVFDYIDDKLVRPALNLQPDDFTFMLNGNIVSFSPDGTVKRVQDGEVIESKGFNLVRNGDFSQGTTRWIGTFGVSTVALSVANKILSAPIVVDSLMGGVRQNTDATYNVGDKVYQKVRYRVTNGDCVTVRVSHGGTVSGGATYIVNSSVSENVWYEQSYLHDLKTGSGDLFLQILHYYADIATAKNKVLETDYIMGINLTQIFGAGNEPTKEEMDEIINRFGFIPNAQDLIDSTEYKGNVLGDMENIIDGLYKTEVLSGEEIYTDKADADAVVHVEIDGKSYQNAGSGKNIAGRLYSAITNGGNSTTTRIVSSPTNKSIIERVKPNTTYTVSKDRKGTRLRYFFYDEFPELDSNVVSIGGNYADYSISTTFTTTSDTKYVAISLGTEEEFSWVQLEEGSTATAYEPPAPTPDYPIEIHSLNNFDVVSSVGRRNLLPSFTGNKWSNLSSSGIETLSPYQLLFKAGSSSFIYTDIELEPKSDYTMTFNSDHQRYYIYRIVDGQQSTIVRTINEGSDVFTFNTGEITEYRILLNNWSQRVDVDRRVWNIKLEKNTATNWSPAPEDITESDNHPLIDKTNILLSEPLRSVDDVKDRLFRDSDGLWKVERNIYSETLNAETRLTTANKDYDTDLTSNRWVTPKYRLSGLSAHSITSHFKREESVWFSDRIGHVVNAGNQYHLNFPNRLLGILESDSASVRENKIRNWLQTQYDEGTPVVIKGVLVEPITELLSDEVQDKLNNLRSFQDSNYVYTVLDKTNILSENLKPTLHAKFLYNNWYKEDRVINNLMIYNRALTNEEMLQNYKTIKRRWGM